MLTATGDGPYRIEIAHVNQDGIQKYAPIHGEVKQGQVIEHQMQQFQPQGIRTAGSAAKLLGLPEVSMEIPDIFHREEQIDVTNKNNQTANNESQQSSFYVYLIAIVLCGCLLLAFFCF